MRALRGFTALAVAALGLALAPTVAAASEPDGGSTAAVVDGSANSVMPPDPVFWELVANWTQDLGTQSYVPRGTGTVRVILPDEVVARAGGDPVTVILTAVNAMGPWPLDSWSDPAASGTVEVDFQQILADIARLKYPDVERIEVWIAGSGESSYHFALTIDLVITEEAATDAIEIPLVIPENAWRSARYEATPVVVGPGARVTVTAPAGFFTTYPTTPKTWAFNESRSHYIDLTSTVSVSADGAHLTATLPDHDVSSLRHLVVMIGDHTTPRHFSISLDLLSPSTDPPPPTNPPPPSTTPPPPSTTPPPPPTNTVGAYVTAVYRDLFGRDPDPTGLAGWTRALTEGTPYSAVADSITASGEFRMGLIRGAYRDYLGRDPDPAGLAAWLDAMNRGLPIQQMEAGFLASPEYYGLQGSGSDAGWIRALYLDVLGRAATEAEVRAWLPAAAGTGRVQVAREFLYSTEKLETDVDGYYQWLLRRGLDPVGRDGWVRLIQHGTRVEAIIAGIIASDEYRANVRGG